LFRAILRITSNGDVPFSHKDVIETLSEKVSIDKEVFLNILELRKHPKEAKKILNWQYEDTIQKLINSTDEILKYVDKI